MSYLRYRLCRLQLSFAIALFAVSAWLKSTAGDRTARSHHTRNQHMVLVDVVATDKQGKAITGLHPEDFVVEENGKQQKISSLVTPDGECPLPGAPNCPPAFTRTGRNTVLPGKAITVLAARRVEHPVHRSSLCPQADAGVRKAAVQAGRTHGDFHSYRAATCSAGFHHRSSDSANGIAGVQASTTDIGWRRTTCHQQRTGGGHTKLHCHNLGCQHGSAE